MVSCVLLALTPTTIHLFPYPTSTTVISSILFVDGGRQSKRYSSFFFHHLLLFSCTSKRNSSPFIPHLYSGTNCKSIASLRFRSRLLDFRAFRCWCSQIWSSSVVLPDFKIVPDFGASQI
ncbi:hypothetical protein Dimus_009618 [Dionaea muscipula]